MTVDQATGANPRLIIGCDGCEQYSGPDSDQGYLPAHLRAVESELRRYLVTHPDGTQTRAVYCRECARYDAPAQGLALVAFLTEDELREAEARRLLNAWREHDGLNSADQVKADAVLLQILALMGVAS